MEEEEVNVKARRLTRTTNGDQHEPHQVSF